MIGGEHVNSPDTMKPVFGQIKEVGEGAEKLLGADDSLDWKLIVFMALFMIVVCYGAFRAIKWAYTVINATADSRIEELEKDKEYYRKRDDSYQDMKGKIDDIHNSLPK